MRTWLILALLTAVALSGCAGEDPDESVDDAGPSDGGDTTGDAGDDQTGGTTGNATGETSDNATSETENAVPVLTVTADVVNGTAPLLVNFTLSVQDDSESITWAFFIDGNETLAGEGATAAFNHTFEAGTYNVTVTASDGEHTVQETLEVTGVPGEEGPEPVTLTGSYVAGGPHQGCVIALFTLGPDNGATYHRAAITPELVGQPYAAEWTFDAPAAAVHIAWVKGSGIFQDDSSDPGASTLTGTVPDADAALVTSCGGAGAAYTLTIG